MLILSRKPGQGIVIDGRITAKVLRLDGEAVKLGITAPTEVPVHRQEVYDEIRKSNAAAVTPRSKRVPKLSLGPHALDQGQRPPCGGSNNIPSHLSLQPPGYLIRVIPADPFTPSLAAALQGDPAKPVLVVEERSRAPGEGHADSCVQLVTRTGKWSQAEPNEEEAARWARIEELIREITGGAAGYDPSTYRILEVGCGRGWLTHLLSRYGIAQGVEPVASVVDHARALFPRLHFLAGDAHTVLNQADFRPYDLVVSSEVLERIPNFQKGDFAAALARLLKPGGDLIITTPRREVLREWTHLNGDPSQPVEGWLTEPRVARLFGSHGFNVGRCERVWFDTTSRKFGGEPPSEGSPRLLGLYQVWSFHRAGLDSGSTTMIWVDPEASVAAFHVAQCEAAGRALERLPDHPALLAAQAQALLGLGEVEQARQVLTRAAALHADDAWVRRLLATVLRQEGAQEEATAHALRAAALEEAADVGDFSEHL